MPCPSVKTRNSIRENKKLDDWVWLDEGVNDVDIIDSGVTTVTVLDPRACLLLSVPGPSGAGLASFMTENEEQGCVLKGRKIRGCSQFH
jgi:hypothetical protein